MTSMILFYMTGMAIMYVFYRTVKHLFCGTGACPACPAKRVCGRGQDKDRQERNRRQDNKKPSMTQQPAGQKPQNDHKADRREQDRKRKAAGSGTAGI